MSSGKVSRGIIPNASTVPGCAQKGKEPGKGSSEVAVDCKVAS